MIDFSCKVKSYFYFASKKCLALGEKAYLSKKLNGWSIYSLAVRFYKIWSENQSIVSVSVWYHQIKVGLLSRHACYRVHEICPSCQTWPAKFGQIWLTTDKRLVFCINRKLMRTDIFFTRTTKHICNFVKPAVKN